jgi:hypothetical protein
MRKYIVGMVFGLILGLSVTAYGAGTIGKAVDTLYPVFINGQKATMDAISIEGVSYLPTRFIAESVGYTVEFKDGQIYLTKPAETVQAVTPQETPTGEVTSSTMSEDYVKVGKVHFATLDIPDKKASIQYLSGEFYINKGAFEKYFDIYKQTITIGETAYQTPKDVAMVKLSGLGLTGTMNGDTLYIQ